jgi:hypothetical protein
MIGSESQASSQSTRPASNRKGKKTLYDARPIAPDPPQPRMQPDEVDMFLSLATALKLYLGRYITDDSIDRASTLFYSYLLTYRRVGQLFAISN